MSTLLLRNQELSTFDNGGWLSEDDASQIPESPLNRNGEALRVMVVVNASKDFTLEALEWALNSVVQPGDTVTLLGVIPDGDNLCGINWKVALQVFLTKISTCWQGHEEFHQEQHQLLEDEITRKKAMFQSSNSLQHFYRICEKKRVDFDVKLAAGVSKYVISHQAESSQATWVVLDRAFKGSRRYFEHHLLCNVVLMKREHVGDIIRVYYKY